MAFRKAPFKCDTAIVENIDELCIGFLFMRVKRYHNSVRLVFFHCHFFPFAKRWNKSHQKCQEGDQRQTTKIQRRKKKKKLSSATSTNAISHNGIMVVVWCAVFFVLWNAKNNAAAQREKKLSAFVINHFFSLSLHRCLDLRVSVLRKKVTVQEDWRFNWRQSRVFMEIDLKNRNE